MRLVAHVDLLGLEVTLFEALVLAHLRPSGQDERPPCSRQHGPEEPAQEPHHFRTSIPSSTGSHTSRQRAPQQIILPLSS